MYSSFLPYAHVPDLIYAGFFILRTYALWNNNRIVLAAMLCFFAVGPTMPLCALCLWFDTWIRLLSLHPSSFCSPAMSLFHVHMHLYLPHSISLTPRSQFTPAQFRVSQVVTRPQAHSSSYHLYSCLCLDWVRIIGISYIIRKRMLMFSPGLLILTLIRAVRDWQTTNGPLYAVLVRHNIEYYACGLRESSRAISVVLQC